MTPQGEAIWAGLEFRTPMVLRNIEPLSEDHLDWIPGEGRKSIRWQLWHIAEVEDNWIRTCLLSAPPRYPFGAALGESTARPDKPSLLQYFHEVRSLSRQRLEAMDEPDFARGVSDPDFGTLNARQLWAGVVTSFAWHGGQIAMTAKMLPGSPVSVWTFTAWDAGNRGTA
ncbi:MAG: DinB family protein [Phycisphaeraceae bacterium]|nr:DinB family protein [Phycisphaeraceae bacterium]